MLFSGHVWSLLGLSRKKKRDDVREYQPDIHSLTHWTYAACRGRGTALPCLCLRQDKARVRKKQTVHRITPISHGETEADARKRKARTRPGRSRKQDCLLASLVLATRATEESMSAANGVCQTTGERRSRDFLWCVHKKRIFVFESGMVGICMEA